MYISHRMAEFMDGQYTGQTCPQKVNPLSHELFLFTNFDKIRYPRVCEIADDESEIRFTKFKMTDP